jgi:iron only hydrogenase large subunit-like protein
VGEIRGLRGIKEALITLPDSSPPALRGKEIRVAVASGIGNARKLLESIASGEAPHYDFIEASLCPARTRTRTPKP